MKKQIVLTIAAIVVVAIVVAALPAVLLFIPGQSTVVVTKNNGAQSIAIIGGADGPTSAFIAGKATDNGGAGNTNTSASSAGVQAENEKTTGDENTMGYTSITMEEAKEIFATEGDYLIVDVRRPDEYAQGHIPGAINIPNEEIPDTEPYIIMDTDRQIYVYCRSGNRSKQAAEKMVSAGYTKVVEFGGIIDWEGEIEK